IGSALVIFHPKHISYDFLGKNRVRYGSLDGGAHDPAASARPPRRAASVDVGVQVGPGAVPAVQPGDDPVLFVDLRSFELERGKLSCIWGVFGHEPTFRLGPRQFDARRDGGKRARTYSPTRRPRSWPSTSADRKWIPPHTRASSTSRAICEKLV